jgi:hypothetical protein
MTVEQLIELLRKLPQDAPVELQVLEPYQDDAALLEEPLTDVKIEDGKVVLA